MNRDERTRLKYYSQNELVNRKVLKNLISQSSISEGDLVYDIGADTGNITRTLLENGARVTAIEKDAGLAVGARAYRLYGPGPQAEAEAVIASQKIVESFRARAKNEINCLEITDLNLKGKIQLGKLLKFFIKGGPVGCLNMAAKYPRQAYGDINTALSEKHGSIPPAPVSCAAVLAQKMGASDMHMVMTAGFAGGIDLSGGGCGGWGPPSGSTE